MHRITLAFDDAVLEREYRRARVPQLRSLAINFALAGLIWTVFAWVGSLALPEHGSAIRWFSFGCLLPTLVLVVTLPLFLPRRARDRVVAAGMPTYTLVGGIATIGLEWAIGERGVYITCLVLALTVATSYAGVGLRFVQTVTMTWTLVALYLTSLVLQPSISRGELAIDAFFLGVAQLWGMQTGYAGERARRRLFLQQREIEAERARSESLLRNMLPEEIAERLKRQPGLIAESFDAVTVLFADLVGFTSLSARMPPSDLIQLLNRIFSAFDEMARRHGLEKIKTIGDAYMVVGGLPTPRSDHSAAVADMAIEMRDSVAGLGDGSLALRIGVHSGPVVAGVIGTAKYSYDLWGDTVNTASRMESHGAPGEIQVSDACRTALGDAFELRERGVVEIKGKGPMRTWWLQRRVA
jgi:class 3 adenylate cyclase